jgi:hypothetical protein
MFAPASSNRSKNSRSLGANSLESWTMARESDCERGVYARWRSRSCSFSRVSSSGAIPYVCSGPGKARVRTSSV